MPTPPTHVLPGTDTNLVRSKFEKLGARAKVSPLCQQTAVSRVIDTAHYRQGEFFGVQADDHAEES